MLHRLTALALTLALVAGNVALCAGWAASPEARMSCCRDAETCPMHRGEPQGSAQNRVMSQAQADSCCAASEQRQSSQSDQTSTTIISGPVRGSGAVVVPPVSPLTATTDWRTIAPIPIGVVPRHVLLSVFLV